MKRYHIAQVNIGRIRGELDEPIMQGFVARLDEINALADGSPGFVWRLQSTEGNSAYLKPYQDERILLNMSVWESVEQLRHFVFHTAHVELMRGRRAWFERFSASYAALWWVPAGHTPGIDEAKKRLAHLDAHGPSEFAFSFSQIIEPHEEFQREIEWSSFEPCPAY